MNKPYPLQKLNYRTWRYRGYIIFKYKGGWAIWDEANPPTPPTTAELCLDRDDAMMQIDLKHFLLSRPVTTKH